MGICPYPCNNKMENGYCRSTGCINPQYAQIIFYSHNMNIFPYRQDAIDALAKEVRYVDGYYVEYDAVISETDAMDAIKALPSAQPMQWIPCSERLPEDEYVLISKKPTKILGDKWSVAIAIRTADPRSGKINWRDSGFGVIQDDKVLAWMPLPESYRGANE